MAFVHGTSLLHRLESERILLPSLYTILKALCVPRELVRAYFYTSQVHLDRASNVHGEGFVSGCRTVLGHAVPTGDGNLKEKGVDAMLVADLIYHAASRNCDMAIVLTHDTDFCHALRRVEDFACRTTLVAVGIHAPDRLRESCDRYVFVSKQELLKHQYGKNRATG
jgi:uncharacterized LabA/DUF88 family protein